MTNGHNWKTNRHNWMTSRHNWMTNGHNWMTSRHNWMTIRHNWICKVNSIFDMKTASYNLLVRSPLASLPRSSPMLLCWLIFFYPDIGSLSWYKNVLNLAANHCLSWPNYQDLWKLFLTQLFLIHKWWRSKRHILDRKLEVWLVWGVCRLSASFYRRNLNYKKLLTFTWDGVDECLKRLLVNM